MKLIDTTMSKESLQVACEEQNPLNGVVSTGWWVGKDVQPGWYDAVAPLDAPTSISAGSHTSCSGRYFKAFPETISREMF